MKTANPQSSRPAPLWLVVAAFVAIYLIWGSTYLGIRYAVESIPPFFMAATRHLVAGVILFTLARWQGARLPSAIEWRDATLIGCLLLVVGNGGVTWAEQTIPSGIAALLVALMPVWMVLCDWWRPGGQRPRALVGAGLVLGLGGVVALVRKQMGGSTPGYSWGVLVLLAASLCWAVGSVFSRTAHKPASPFLGVSLQMLTGGVIMLGIAGVRGEFREFSPAHVSAVSFWAWAYLTVAGSLVAYTAYVWLIHVSTPAKVATCAYVNPLIAVLLGCTIGHEAFTHDIFLAGALIIAAVVLVLRGGNSKSTPAPPTEDVA